jgi:ATP-binding cassette, subfamily B, bacterial PglK
MKDSIAKLLMLFNKREKRKLLILFFMMIIASLLETVSIGLIVPFVNLVTNPEIIMEQSLLKRIYEYMGFESIEKFIVISVVFFLAIFVIKNLYLLFFQYTQYRVILNQQVKLSRDLFQEYLSKPYEFHLQKNTANLLRNVNTEVPKVFQGIIIAAFQLSTEVLVVICLLSLLIITTPIPTIVASSLLAGSVLTFFRLFRKKISQLGKEQQVVSGTMIKWVNQGLGASKEVKVSGKEKFFVNAYTSQSQIRARNSMYLKMLDQVPRYFIETLLVAVVLITMTIIILQGMDTNQLVSTMALFAMAAFRLMPSINRIMSLITSIKISQPSLSVVHEDLFLNKEVVYSNCKNDLHLAKGERTFKDCIKLTDVSFRYPQQKGHSVKDVSLTIPIGKSVAFIGESGAGKTTIVDIILGLFHPEKGEVLVDGKNLFEQRSVWQRKIGYIPQSIFLSDDSIRSNVAFGIEKEKINDEDVWRALEQAQLKEFVESLPDNLETTVGERGVRLSGGQRQRLGIARALYHDPEILFMDEATSALDNETEKEIMAAIDGLKGEKTLIIIAHRLSTIENCDVVFKMKRGNLIGIDNRDEYMKNIAFN